MWTRNCDKSPWTRGYVRHADAGRYPPKLDAPSVLKYSERAVESCWPDADLQGFAGAARGRKSMEKAPAARAWINRAVGKRTNTTPFPKASAGFAKSATHAPVSWRVPCAATPGAMPRRRWLSAEGTPDCVPSAASTRQLGKAVIASIVARKTGSRASPPMSRGGRHCGSRRCGSCAAAP